jgi:hypothetical protein
MEDNKPAASVVVATGADEVTGAGTGVGAGAGATTGIVLPVCIASSISFISILYSSKQPRMVRAFLKIHTRPRLAYALRCRGYGIEYQ